jgi:hypothetical protein
VVTAINVAIIGNDRDLILLPDSEALIEGAAVVGTRLRVQQGQPADIAPAEGLSAVWTLAGGSSFQNTIPVSTLPVGTHRFTGALRTSDGQLGQVIVEVVVAALEFVVEVVEPAADVDYFIDTGLPLRATVRHGWQSGFQSPSTTWRLPTGRIVGNGLLTTAQGIEPGLTSSRLRSKTSVATGER